ncbi:MAG: cytochrome b [Pseudomonadota bacterium]
MLKDSTSGYGFITIILHWVCASLILFLFGLGVYMRGLDYYSPWYHRGPVLHISLGLLVLLLMTLRMFWRLSNKNPKPLPSIGERTHLAATIVKIALYVFTFVICVSGYFITTAEGKPAVFFDVFSVPALIELNSVNVDRVGLIHKLMAWGLIGIAILHGSAALFHHFVKRDRTLVRMLTPTKKIV